MKSYEVYDIIEEIMTHGIKSNPRGQEITELHYFQGRILDPFSNYTARKYPLDYFKAEMQWYLNADPKDLRIFKHAKMWEKIQQPDGSILSNYGQYWFGPQRGFKWVIDTLTRDPDSRQAYIAMNNFYHAYPGNPDFVCTKGIQFRLIDGYLNMHVSMRSSDAIYGLATDLPCFWVLWKMIGETLGVPYGSFIFSADSVHIYSRHYEMAKEIIANGRMDRTQMYVPSICGKSDVQDLLDGSLTSDFGKWLTMVKL